MHEKIIIYYKKNIELFFRLLFNSTKKETKLKKQLPPATNSKTNKTAEK